jgi:WD40 repeat protein
VLRRRSLALFTPLALVACGDGGGPGSGPGLRVVAGDGITDTANAILPRLLVVELRDSANAPVPQSQITFEGRDCIFTSICSAYVEAEGGDRFSTIATDTTDARGQARVRVLLGPRAGEGRIRITSDSTDQIVTALYTIRHASLFFVVVVPADTAVYPGASYRLRPSTFDAFGNARSDDQVSYRVLAGPATVAADGILEGTSIGRGTVEVASGEARDTVALSVVPNGTLAARRWQDNTELHRFELDGSGLQPVAETGFVGGGAAAWSPSGDTLVFEVSTTPFDSRLFLSDLTSAPVPLAPADTAIAQLTPRFSRDGSWIYFRGQHPARAGEIWRVHPDGSGLERVGEQSTSSESDLDPDPSPDGARVAYATTRGSELPQLLIRTLGTGAELRPGLQGSMPRWSPDGAWIAYWRAPSSGLLGTIHLVRPDGSDDHAVGRTDAHYPSGIDWSPDGTWLVARAEGRLELIHATTGEVLPLGYSEGYDWPAWRPE